MAFGQAAMSVRIEAHQDKMPTITCDNAPEYDDGSYQYFIHNHTSPEMLTKMADNVFNKEPDVAKEYKGSQVDFINTLLQEGELQGLIYRQYLNYLMDIFAKHLTSIEIKKDEDITEEHKEKGRLTVIPDDLYDTFILQIHRLPQRKRKKWKEKIKDKWGKVTEIRWRFNKLMENQGERGWVEVRPMDAVLDENDDLGYAYTPEGAVSLAKSIMRKEKGKNYCKQALEQIYQRVLEICQAVRTEKWEPDLDFLHNAKVTVMSEE